MASAKVERPAGAQAQVQTLFGQMKKEPVKPADGATKAQASKPAAAPASKSTPKKAEPKPREPKKKAKSVKPAAKK